MSDSSQRITLQQAVQMTTRAREQKLLPINAWHFDRAVIDEILAAPNVAGIRIYLGVNDDNAPNVVVVATNAAGADLVASPIAEKGRPCPPYCDDESPLNGARRSE